MRDSGEEVTQTAALEMNKVKLIMGSLMDAIAVMLISTCVIPIGILLILVWIVKTVFAYSFFRKVLFGKPKSRSV